MAYFVTPYYITPKLVAGSQLVKMVWNMDATIEWHCLCIFSAWISSFTQEHRLIMTMYKSPQSLCMKDYRDLMVLSYYYLQIPMEVADSLFHISHNATSYLVECLVEGKGLDLGWHQWVVRKALAALRTGWAVAEAAFLEWYGGRDRKSKHMLVTACKAGTWLSALPQRMNGTKMCDLEFCDALRLLYNFHPLCLETVCYGCGGKFLAEHAMSCKLGGLIWRRHEVVKQEFIRLVKLAFGHTHVIDEPKIFSGCGVWAPAGATATKLQGDSRQGLAWIKTWGDIVIDRLWKTSMTAVFDVWVADPNAKIFQGRSPVSVIQQEEREKVHMYVEPCQAMWWHITPLVYSVMGMSGKEMWATEKCLASAQAEKIDQQYLEMVVWVRQLMCLAVARQATVLFCGNLTPWLIRAHTTVLDGA